MTANISAREYINAFLGVHSRIVDQFLIYPAAVDKVAQCNILCNRSLVLEKNDNFAINTERQIVYPIHEQGIA